MRWVHPSRVGVGMLDVTNPSPAFWSQFTAAEFYYFNRLYKSMLFEACFIIVVSTRVLSIILTVPGITNDWNVTRAPELGLREDALVTQRGEFLDLVPQPARGCLGVQGGRCADVQIQ